ncbi:CHASE2 domain-containing protein [uncultured Erythrobacter sp.]|uniref:CHASE2 domain-containing protein n=1 Tax=uncultured Erythrobacter sp. TaxID=263913 RepID=UPI00261AE4CF|nr:CHASE2 domain-containing protein [uncultured Erythrobacter sp.]
MTGSVSKSEDIAQEAGTRMKLVRAVILGGIVGVMLAFLLGTQSSRAVFDSWQRLSPREISTENVAVILIDDDSVVGVDGAEGKVGWPWPRKLVAQLVEKIGEADPALIGIDIYFPERDPLRPEAFASLYADDDLDAASRAAILDMRDWDYELARVIGETPSVMARAGVEYGLSDQRDYFFESQVQGEAPAGTLALDNIVATLFELEGAALSQAMVDGAPDDDAIVRRVPLSVRVGDKHPPGFALELARLGLGVEELRWEGQSLFMDRIEIPADANGTMRFKMGEFPAAADHSAADILSGRIGAEELQGKIVILGVGATGTYDIVGTPLNEAVFGAFVQAQAVDAIIEGEWLARPAWAIGFELVAGLLLFAIVLIAAMTQRARLLAPAIGIALLLPLVSWAAFDQANLLLDPSRALIIWACAAIGLWIMRFLITREELVQEHLLVTLHEEEMEFARRIQMSMVPGETTLARLDQRAEIAGVLEPAKTVGGDFFDALKIGDDKLLFLVGDVSGKGMAAALYMALSKTAAKSNLARASDGLQNAVAALNQDLMDEADPEMGLTMLVGILDCSTGDLELVNAGHENPLIVRADQSVETFGMIGGPPFCVIDFNYPVEHDKLEPGDTLVIITDGATEAANVDDKLFGVEGVVGALKAANDRSAKGRAQHLAKQVRVFEGPTDPSDDLTIFALRFLGS